jgi:hypothetical protein
MNLFSQEFLMSITFFWKSETILLQFRNETAWLFGLMIGLLLLEFRGNFFGFEIFPVFSFLIYKI